MTRPEHVLMNLLTGLVLRSESQPKLEPECLLTTVIPQLESGKP